MAGNQVCRNTGVRKPGYYCSRSKTLINKYARVTLAWTKLFSYGFSGAFSYNMRMRGIVKRFQKKIVDANKFTFTVVALIFANYFGLYESHWY